MTQTLYPQVHEDHLASAHDCELVRVLNSVDRELLLAHHGWHHGREEMIEPGETEDAAA